MNRHSLDTLLSGGGFKHLIAIGEPPNAEPLLRLAAGTFKDLSSVAGSEEANRLLYELEKPSDTEAALVGAPVRPGETTPIAVQHVVRSFDPCMVCTVH